MDSKYKYIQLFFVLVFCLNFVISQNKKKIVFEKISKESFISNSPENITNLNNYTCTSCAFQIEYIRSNTVNNYHDSFIINKKIFKIDELLNEQQIEFYIVNYINKKYLFVFSPDFGSSKFSYLFKHYYLFELNNQNNVTKFNKLILSKLSKEKSFLKLSTS